MKDLKLSFVFLLFPLVLWSQSSFKAFKKLSRAEKCWVVTHPLKAKKAFKVSKEVKKVVDSIKKQGDLGNHFIGNQLDAFKHAFWLWQLAEKIGWRSAKKLGKAHEKGNYQFYKKHKTEDGILPDQISTDMDLFNNAVGLSYYKYFKTSDLSKIVKIELIKAAVLNGEMKMIYQKSKNVYLDKNGMELSNETEINSWNNSKVLVPSDTVYEKD